MTLSDLGIGPRAIWGAQRAYDEVTGEEHQLWADAREFCRMVGVVDLLRARNMGAVSILELMEALAAHGLHLQPKVGDERLVRQQMGGRRFREHRDRILALRRDASPAVERASDPGLATWYPG